MSLFLWGDAVAVLLALMLCLLPPLAGGPYKNQTRQQSSATHILFQNLVSWGLTPVRRTFRLFWGPVLLLWPVEGVRCRAAAGADLGGFLARGWYWLVTVSFFLETAPLPATTNIHRNITVESLWSESDTAHRSPRIQSKHPPGRRFPLEKDNPVWSEQPSAGDFESSLPLRLQKRKQTEEKETFKRKLKTPGKKKQSRTEAIRGWKACPGHISPQNTKKENKFYKFYYFYNLYLFIIIFRTITHFTFLIIASTVQ